MPELPDVTVYIECLMPRVVGRRLEGIRIGNPFVLRTVEPPLSSFVGLTVQSISRIGKRIVLEFETDRFLVIHLMIAGRLRWRERGASVPAKIGLAAFDFADGTLLLTEASPKKRASIHAAEGRQALAAWNRGGIEPLEATIDAFRNALLKENHTLKRALTDPRLFSGIGNAYSDEILHRARLSPVQWTKRLREEDISRLYRATQSTLQDWTQRLRAEAGSDFPEKVTAFRKEMAVHGRFRQPCPDCGSPVQRIRYADNETNYCAQCQTGGRLLSDRSLSRLLKSDWPKTLEELEERFGGK